MSLGDTGKRHFRALLRKLDDLIRWTGAKSFAGLCKDALPTLLSFRQGANGPSGERYISSLNMAAEHVSHGREQTLFILLFGVAQT